MKKNNTEQNYPKKGQSLVLLVKNEIDRYFLNRDHFEHSLVTKQLLRMIPHMTMD